MTGTLQAMPSATRRSILAALAVGIALVTVAVVLARPAGAPLPIVGPPGATTSGSAPFAASPVPPSPGAVIAVDVVVFGATPSGILAAVSAARMGASVALVTPEAQVGGMMTSGLGHADVGRRDLIGGLTHEVFERLGDAETGSTPMPTLGWNYEPHVALAVFEGLLHEAHVVVYPNEHLDRARPVELEGDRIVDMLMTSGTRFRGTMFVDASYEGDLMAAAGVPFAIGRESRAAYGESLAGVRVDETAKASSLVSGLDAIGKPLPGVAATAADAAAIQSGSSDGLVQPATFRLCVTADPSNRIRFDRPAGYDPTAYALVGRAIAKGRGRDRARPGLASILTFASLPDGKADLNNRGLFSTDLVGGATGWANGDDATRQAIAAQHRAWVSGLLWYLETDPAVPPALRREMAGWGLCADEFRTTGGWPPELYVREARRLIGNIVLTQRDIQQDVTKPDPIALGTYRIDAHFVRRVLGRDGLVRGDGQLSAPTKPYEIPYAAIVPPTGSVDNLLVSVTISASHVAWASIRTEPTLMEIGEAAGVAAALAVRGRVGVREVEAAAIEKVLLAHRGILSVPPSRPPTVRRANSSDRLPVGTPGPGRAVPRI